MRLTEQLKLARPSAAAEKAIALVLRHEGGLVDHPRDPGGITKYGISLRAYPRLGREGIKRLTAAEAAAIYLRDYWHAIRGDELPPAVAVCVMDAAVNSGVTRAARWLQAAAEVPRDGAIGPATLQAVNESDDTATALAVCDLRLDFLRALETWDTFGKGWQRRVDATLHEALKLARPR